MTARDDLDQALSRWMADGPSVVRDAVIDVALDEARHTRQRGGRFAPWRYLTMTATPVGREGRSFAPAIAAAALLLAVAIGAFIVARPDIGIGNFGEPRVYTEDDIVAVVTTPDALTAALVRRTFRRTSTSSRPAAGTTPCTSPSVTPRCPRISVSRSPRSCTWASTRQPSRSTTRSGRTARRFRWRSRGCKHDGPAATYDDAAAADLAFESFVTAYETWEFAAGMEAWDHGDEARCSPIRCQRTHTAAASCSRASHARRSCGCGGRTT